MTKLSPAAQAVLDAAETGLDGYIELLPPTWKSSVAASLRAAADQVVPEKLESYGIRYVLLRIADELEAQ